MIDEYRGIAHTGDRRRTAPLLGDRRDHLRVAVLEPRVRCDDDAGLAGPGPERVEHRVGRRLRAVRRERRTVADRDDPRPVVEAPVQLLDRLVDVRQRQERDPEDPIAVGEAPVLLEPPVERAQDVDRGLDVGLHRALHADALRREQPRALDALLVHAAEARVTVVPLRVLRRHLARELVAHARLGAPAGEVVVQRARPRAQMDVTGPRDDRVESLAERVPRLAVDVDQRHSAVRELRVAVSGERVARLPVVVVGVEDRGELVARVPHQVPLRQRSPVP